MSEASANLTADDLVRRWNGAVTTGTLSNWRHQAKGPPFVKIGRSVRYPLATLVDWERANMRLVVANDNQGAK